MNNIDYRISIEEAMLLELTPKEIGCDTYTIEAWDYALTSFFTFESMLIQLCEMNEGLYFIEIEYSKNEIIVSYIYYAD